MTPGCPIIVGSVGQYTVVQANIAESLVGTRTLVRSLTVYPDSANTGTLLVSYGGAPLLPALTLSPVGGPVKGGAWYDLSMVQVKSTVAGDKANWNAVYGP